MRYFSTRGASPGVTFTQAILQGLAPDGGLYVPEAFPRLELQEDRFPRVAARFLRPFLAGDPLEAQLDAICEEAFDFPVPLVHMTDDTSLLELFHGPTAAFKDFGARFLGSCLSRILSNDTTSRGGGAPLTVLVATSGDTGAAVAAAFHRKPGIEVGVLFPKDGVSARQERQLTCWGDNVRSFVVRGTFDDCQRLVKAAFADATWRREGGLSSANSINIGRLLPQAAYYAAASLQYRRERAGAIPGFIVPSGNVGNAVGALWSKRMGFPIRAVALATNANRVVPDWVSTGRWDPRRSVKTLANAMDVGNPSNMERVFHLYRDREAFASDASVLSVDDETIRRVIAEGPSRWGRIFCPHTATAVHFREQLDSPHWIIVATAHPAKFDSIVEPLIGRRIDLPDSLAELLSRPVSVTEIGPDLAELQRAW